jgi:hypothetical protein
MFRGWLFIGWRSEPEHGYSPRNAWTGSTEAARRAGRTEAARARAKTAIAASSITTGSKGLT